MRHLLGFTVLAACGGSSAPSPDAAPPLLVGDFSCAGVPWQTTAPDPLAVAGNIGIPGATVEIHSADTDALFASGTTTNSVTSKGGYSFQIPTGGVAPKIYRKFTASGYLDSYAVDPMAQFTEFSFGNWIPDPSLATAFYQNLGLPYDATKGIVLVHIVDCMLPGPNGVHPVEGATVDAPPGASLLYVPPDGTPFTAATADLTATTTAGQVLVLGVTPGEVDITVHAGPVTYRSWPVQVRANTFTWSPRHP